LNRKSLTQKESNLDKDSLQEDKMSSEKSIISNEMKRGEEFKEGEGSKNN